MDAIKTTVVLLVEDDPGDQKLVRKALSNQEMLYELHIAGSGEEALEYLQRSRDRDKQSPRPDLILLDLNMPGMGGKEFLKCIKADDDLCAIPVVVLTVSDSEIDIQECYGLHAAGYIQKSATADEFQKLIGNLSKYWFATSSFAKN
jgi:CheY-like chemotaxis protein